MPAVKIELGAAANFDFCHVAMPAYCPVLPATAMAYLVKRATRPGMAVLDPIGEIAPADQPSRQ